MKYEWQKGNLDSGHSLSFSHNFPYKWMQAVCRYKMCKPHGPRRWLVQNLKIVDNSGNPWSENVHAHFFSTSLLQVTSRREHLKGLYRQNQLLSFYVYYSVNSSL